MDKDLARTFELARDLIATDQQWYICEAVDRLYDRGQIRGWERDRAFDTVRARLGDCMSVEDWLQNNVPEYTAWLDSLGKQGHSQKFEDQLRDYRVRWLSSLIKEFSGG